MESFLKHFLSLEQKDLEFDALKGVILESGIFELDLKDHLPPEPEPGEYSRRSLCTSPLDITIIRWPSHGESAIHHHEGFWGYVAVLDGVIENEEYRLEGNKLRKHEAAMFSFGALLPEPNGVIHRISNVQDKPALSVHFYYPSIKSFEGMEIFDLEERKKGVLGSLAKSASWSQDTSAFEKIEEKAFEIDLNDGRISSFKMLEMFPKPEPSLIQGLTNQYFSELAKDYDSFDSQEKNRSLYIRSINSLIVKRIQKEGWSDYSALSIGCGTGRRDKEILDATLIPYKLYGIDLSPEMCLEARRRGINVKQGAWMHVDMEGEKFDLIYFLYGFGHLPSHSHRVNFLKKIRKHLKKGGILILDVFNIEDQFEWGPRAKKHFQNMELEKFGYEEGDVFYRKIGFRSPAFLHYFSVEELVDLLKESGFGKPDFEFIGYRNNPGENVESDEGVIFLSVGT